MNASQPEHQVVVALDGNVDAVLALTASVDTKADVYVVGHDIDAVYAAEAPAATVVDGTLQDLAAFGAVFAGRKINHLVLAAPPTQRKKRRRKNEHVAERVSSSLRQQGAALDTLIEFLADNSTVTFVVPVEASGNADLITWCRSALATIEENERRRVAGVRVLAIVPTAEDLVGPTWWSEVVEGTATRSVFDNLEERRKPSFLAEPRVSDSEVVDASEPDVDLVASVTPLAPPTPSAVVDAAPTPPVGPPSTPPAESDASAEDTAIGDVPAADSEVERIRTQARQQAESLLASAAAAAAAEAESMRDRYRAVEADLTRRTAALEAAEADLEHRRSALVQQFQEQQRSEQEAAVAELNQELDARRQESESYIAELEAAAETKLRDADRKARRQQRAVDRLVAIKLRAAADQLERMAVSLRGRNS